MRSAWATDTPPLAGAFALRHQARVVFLQVQVRELQMGDFADPQAAAQHEREDGQVAGVCDHGEELAQFRLLHRARQPLGFAQVMSAGVHRAGQFVVLRHEERVQRSDGGQPAIDGGRLEALFELLAEEPVDVAESDLICRAVTNQFQKEVEVAAIILPGMGVWAAPADPIDEPLDFG